MDGVIVGSTEKDIARIRIYDAMRLLVCGNIHEVELSLNTIFPAMIFSVQQRAKPPWNDFERPDPGSGVSTNLFSPLRRTCFRTFAWTGMGLCFFYSSCPTIWRLFFEATDRVAGLPFLHPKDTGVLLLTRLCSMIAWNGFGIPCWGGFSQGWHG